MNRRLDRPFRQLATVGAIALALLCGRRADSKARSIRRPRRRRPRPRSTGNRAAAAGETISPQPARKRIFLDWLLDC